MGLFSRTDDVAPPTVSSTDVRPLGPTLVRAVLDSWDATYGVDDNGDIGGYWDGHLFSFVLAGPERSVLNVRGRWTREVGPAGRLHVLDLLNGWHERTLFPKAYVRVEEETLGVYAELNVPVWHGTRPEDLDVLLRHALGASLDLFTRLDEEFPEAAAEATRRRSAPYPER